MKKIKLSSLNNPVEMDKENGYYYEIVNTDMDPSDDWIQIDFYMFDEGYNGETYLSRVWTIEGYSGSLREGRHSYFGEDGYIYYLNRKFMEQSFEVASKYFDLD